MFAIFVIGGNEGWSEYSKFMTKPIWIKEEKTIEMLKVDKANNSPEVLSQNEQHDEDNKYVDNIVEKL